MKKTILIALGIMISFAAEAQTGKVQVTKNLNYRQPVTPVQLDNYLYNTFYATGKKSYNLKGFETSAASYEVISFKVNPAGTSYAMLSSNGKKSSVEVFDVYRQGQLLKKFKEVMAPTAICYSVDSRLLYIADAGSQLVAFDSKTFVQKSSMSLDLSVSEMTASPNGYFIAAAGQNSVAIVNLADKNIRKTISESAKVVSAVFSDDSENLAVLLANGTVHIYDTHGFNQTQSFENLGNVAGMAFHPDGKYLAVTSNANTLLFLNIMDNNDRLSLNDPDGKMSYVRFVKDGKKQTYLTYNSVNTIKYRLVAGFEPNFTKLMKDQLNARMMDWCKRKPNESEEEYLARTSEESKAKQKKLFAHEIATSLAGDRVSHSNVSLGKYNPATGTLGLTLSGLSPIFLKVPKEDIGTFTNTDDLVISEPVYGLTKNDKFELIYAKVTNKATGKTYIFDNLEQQSLDFLQTDDSFVSLDLIQKASHEEVLLQGIKNKVVNTAKEQNLISDHTHINVDAHVTSDYDANGNRINNYNVEIDYNVDAEYSIKEDFAAGKYKIEQSHAAISMLQIAKDAFEGDFSQYIKAGKKLIVTITGSADAIPINGTIAYDECYGVFDNEPYYLNGDLGTISVSKATGIKKNEQLAFMRAQGVKSYVVENLKNLEQMDVQYKYLIELADGVGGEYRRIKLSFTFIDAM